MALDQTTIGKLVTEQMQALESDYDDDKDHRIGAVITIVEILTPEGEATPQGQAFRSEIRSRNNIGDPFRALGLLRIAEQSIIQSVGSRVSRRVRPATPYGTRQASQARNRRPCGARVLRGTGGG